MLSVVICKSIKIIQTSYFLQIQKPSKRCVKNENKHILSQAVKFKLIETVLGCFWLLKDF
jgi:hypothetical protein